MVSSINVQVLVKVRDLLVAAGIDQDQVLLTNLGPLDETYFPLIDIDPISDRVDALGTGTDAHRFEFQTLIVDRERPPAAVVETLDATATLVHRTIMADPTLGGLVASTRTTQVDWDIRPEQGTGARVVIRWLAVWDTSLNDLTKAALW